MELQSREWQSRNNTNPILDPHSAEYAVIRARGIEVAHDGMLFQVYT